MQQAELMEHHYFSKSLPTSGFFALVRHGPFPVAFVASGILMGAYNGGITYREQRLVVLPNYQGFGLGPRISELIAQKYLDNGKRYDQRVWGLGS